MTGAAPALAAPAPDFPLPPPRTLGNGKSVLILGAGVGGLTAALILLRAGFNVRILEAQGRAGGRSFTVRRGSQVTEQWPDGPRTLECEFDEGLYLNLGPGRIPYHHRRVINTCNQLGVPLQPYIMETTANLYAPFGGAAMVNRRIANDTRGWIAQLAASQVQGSSDLTSTERGAMLSLLREFGQLNEGLTYEGSTRSGLAEPLSITQTEEPIAPLPLAGLLASGFWENQFYHPLDWDWEPTLFQPVGGMDMIVRYLAGALGEGVLSLNSPVTGIKLVNGGVEVAWNDEQTGPRSNRWDYCLSSIPFPVLKGILLGDRGNGFSVSYLNALGATAYEPACKVGWQANSRFWESDKYGIYGGISWLDDEAMQIWYPSNDFFTAKGTLTGAYNFAENAIKTGNRSHAERLRVARAAGTMLHEEFADQSIIPDALGMSIAWQKVPYQLGGFASWHPQDIDAYRTLIYPEGNFLIIGDQVSPLPGWQEGAMMSAQWAADLLTSARPLVRQAIQRAPDTRKVTRGIR
jgi:monoamine oxidase